MMGWKGCGRYREGLLSVSVSLSALNCWVSMKSMGITIAGSTFLLLSLRSVVVMMQMWLAWR